MMMPSSLSLSYSIVDKPDQQRHVLYTRSTLSTVAQEETQDECAPYFVPLHTLPPSQVEHLHESGLLVDHDEIALLVQRHVTYLEQGWNGSVLKWHYVSLDASRTWMIYWTLHACDLLDHDPSSPATVTHDISDRIIDTIAACYQDDDGGGGGGGFGGGPGQLPHAATNYAAVLALCILAHHNDRALQLLQSKRHALGVWMASLQQQQQQQQQQEAQLEGGFCMHKDGEVDVRATYCITVVAKLLGIQLNIDYNKAIAFVAKCQGWEGGFGGEPMAEAHGGYTFCAVGALVLLNGLEAIDVPALTGWLSRRQMSMEGGFQGRTNKLVDGCYSFWQGGAMAIVGRIVRDGGLHGDPWLNDDDDDDDDNNNPPLLFDRAMLQRYILLCAQEPHGGLRDKPSKSRDFYHSCYNLSGLSVAQHYGAPDETSYGHATLSHVARTHPVYNIRVERVRQVQTHFATLHDAHES